MKSNQFWIYTKDQIKLFKGSANIKFKDCTRVSEKCYKKVEKYMMENSFELAEVDKRGFTGDDNEVRMFVLKDLIYKENKSALHYMLQSLDHSKYFYTFEESFTKDEMREACIKLMSANSFYKCRTLAPYKFITNQ